MAGMVERQKEWQNGRMAEMAIYILFMVHTDNNDDDDDDDDTLIFYITESVSEEPTFTTVRVTIETITVRLQRDLSQIFTQELFFFQYGSAHK